uniref:Rho termination factor n=1 Tax=Marseillevirus LCMAC101 TaxID=2506602 RepID=A0A481YS18_9VIRU|nr:MAG: Rho termination factor [Marseillevirus LCMAC101]
MRLTMDADKPVYLTAWGKKQKSSARQKKGKATITPIGEQRKLKPAEVKKMMKLGVPRVGENESPEYYVGWSTTSKKGSSQRSIFDEVAPPSGYYVNGKKINGKLDSRTVVELRQLAKSRGKKGYSKLRKAQLVALLRNGNGNGKPSTKKSSKKTPVRKTAAKKTGMAKVRTDSKGFRYTLLSDRPSNWKLEDLTVSELKRKAKSKGYRRYSKLKKAELVAMIRNGGG